MTNNTIEITSQADQSRPWTLILGFIVGFLALAAITGVLGLYAVGIDSGKIAVLRGDSVAWTPPPLPAIEPEAVVPVEENSSNDVESLNKFVRNITSSIVNVRQTPGYKAKSPSDVIAQAQPGQEVEIVDGPQVADGLNWWLIRLDWNEDIAEGWIAEATSSGVQILGE